MAEQKSICRAAVAQPKRISQSPPKKETIWGKYYKHRHLLIMLLPVMIYYFIFHYGPIYGITIAFKDFYPLQGIMDSPWVGLKYFKQLVTDPYFLPALRNTLIISFWKLLLGFPAPIILAIMLNEVRRAKVKKFFQTVTYLPHFLSWVVLSGLLIEMLSPSRGPINLILKALGFEPIFFLADPEWFRPVIIASGIWRELGWQSIIFLAAITNIDPELYSVADLDGAGKLRKMWNITLPSIMPVIIIMMILSVGNLIKDDFDQIYNLLNGNVLSVGEVLSTYTYKTGLVNMNYSYSTAVGVFKNVISFILVMGANFFASKMSDGETTLF